MNNDGMKLFIDQAMGFLGDLNNVVNEIDEIKKVSVLKTDSEKEIKTVYKQFDVIAEGLNKQSKKVGEKIEKLETMLIGIINESVKRTKKEQENLKEELKADITAFGPLLSEVKEMIGLVYRDHKREYEELEGKVSNKLEKTDLDEINKKLKKKYIDDENISEKTAYSSKKTIEKIDSMINNLRLGGRSKLFILDEGSDLGQATAINFTGSAVDVTVVNGVHTVDVTGERITPRVTSEASSATPTINTDNSDIHRITALAANITSMTTNLSGTPTHGQKLIVEITGTATRTIAWGSSFEASTVALPTTTVSTAMLTVGFMRNSATSKWRCIAVA